MNATDTSRDPKTQINDAITEIRQSLGGLRESVVTAVMRRNRLQDEVNRQERLIADLETKAALAEKIDKPDLATELREERRQRLAALERLRAELNQAALDADTAKTRLPEEEARLSKQVNDLRAQLAQLMSGRAEANVTGTPGTASEALWEQAMAKAQGVTAEAAARTEVAGIGTPPPITTPISAPPVTPVPSLSKSAEDMLAELEAKMGLAPPPSSASFLELDREPPAPPAPAIPRETIPTMHSEPPFEIPSAPSFAEPPTTNGKLPEASAPSSEEGLPFSTPPTLVWQLENTPPAPLETPVETKAEALAPVVEPPKPEIRIPEAPIGERERTMEMSAQVPEVPERTMPTLESPLFSLTEEAPVTAPVAVQPETSVVTPPVVEPVAVYEAPAPPPVVVETAPLIQERPQPIVTAPPVAEVPVVAPAEVAPSPIVEPLAPAVPPQERVAPPPVLETVAPVAVATGLGAAIAHETAPSPVREPQPVREQPMTPAPAAKGVALMDPTRRIRVAAIGTGNIFRGAHLPAYLDIAQAQLVAFCDPDKKARDLAYERYHQLADAKIKQAKENGNTDLVERLERDLDSVTFCEDIREVIATVKPDLMDICTQPFLHVPLSIQALEAGFHVMCEKPIARSWLESQRLIETVHRTGRFYQHNENWLWDKDYYTAKKLLDSGAIGELILMFLATAHGGPEGSPKFWNSDFGGGGALLDNGIHAIGASWFLSGLEKRPTMVKAAEPFGMSIRMPQRLIDGRYQQVTVDDDAHILIRFESDNTGAWTTAHVEGSWSHRDSPDTVLIGTTGKIHFANEDNRRYAIVTDSYDREMRRIEVSGPTWQHWPSSFYGEILNMVECIRNGVPSICTAEFGAECSAVVGASYLSEKHGRQAVSVTEFKEFARGIAARYPNPADADNALIEALLSAVRNK